MTKLDRDTALLSKHRSRGSIRNSVTSIDASKAHKDGLRALTPRWSVLGKYDPSWAGRRCHTCTWSDPYWQHLLPPTVLHSLYRKNCRAPWADPPPRAEVFPRPLYAWLWPPEKRPDFYGKRCAAAHTSWAKESSCQQQQPSPAAMLKAKQPTFPLTSSFFYHSAIPCPHAK